MRCSLEEAICQRQALQQNLEDKLACESQWSGAASAAARAVEQINKDGCINIAARDRSNAMELCGSRAKSCKQGAE
jgi:hypothetical protein